MVHAPAWLELTLRIQYAQATESTGNGASTLALKTHGQSQPKSEIDIMSGIYYMVSNPNDLTDISIKVLKNLLSLLNMTYEKYNKQFRRGNVTV